MLQAHLLTTALVLPGSSPKVAVRPADTNAARGAIFGPVAEVCADCLFDPKTSQDKALLTATLRRDLSDRFGSRNRADHILVVAEDTGSEAIVGSVGIEVSRLTSAALNEQQATSDDWYDTAQERPLLSNLAVSRDYRRRGIAKKLCRDAEAAVKSWGYDEVLLKVEKGNRKAFNLYKRLGYRVVATDPNAEKPIVATGGLKYVKTTNIAMRKDLRYPPLDTALSSAGTLVLAAALAPKYDALAQTVVSAFEGGAALPPAQLASELLQACWSVIVS